MNLERRIKRLEEQYNACNHRSPVILANPTEEQVERMRKELGECPSCSRHGQTKLIIMKFLKFD